MGLVFVLFLSIFSLPSFPSVARILYIYAALNPGISYVQGMNEIVAPMYYLFIHDAKVFYF